VKRRFDVLLVLGLAACGGGNRAAAPAPQTIQDTVTGFLAAVRAKDLNRMGQLWGNDRGPAAQSMKPEELSQRLTVIQIYLAHSGYRLVDGPSLVPGNDRLRTFRVELQRPNCTRVVPLDLMQTRSGSWVVYDVHLEAAGNPMLACTPAGGTRP
jgi:hypothetical protein